MKRTIYLLLLALLVPVGAHAQSTKAQLNAEIVTSFPDNHVGAITPFVLRTVTSDIVNSIMPTAPVVNGNSVCFNGTTGLLKDCGSSPASIPVVNSPTGVPTRLRQPLSGPTPLYVNGTGFPQTCGTLGTLACGVGSSTPANPFDPATPFDTLTNAATYLGTNIDSRGFVPTINLSHGNHIQQFTCQSNPLLGQITFIVAGDYTSPTAANLIAPNGLRAMVIRDGCTPSVSSIRISDQGSSAGGIQSGQGGIADFRSVTISGFNTGSAVFGAIDHGHINMLGADTTNGVAITNTFDGVLYGQLFQGQFGGLIHFNGQTIAIPSAITVGGGQPFAFFAGFGMVEGATAGTFTGAGVAGTTGIRCVWVNSYSANIDPNTIFPGNSSCTPTNVTF